MKQITLIVIFVASITLTRGQSTPREYFNLVKQADSFYKAKEYKKSGYKYSEAFKLWKGFSYDRYNAACSWTLAAIPDSAFSQLNEIVMKENYAYYKYIENDQDLKPLHKDKRWAPLLEIVKQNEEKAKTK